MISCPSAEPFSLCVIWWITGDATYIFYCRDIHLYSLISLHIPQKNMPQQDFHYRIFVSEDQRKSAAPVGENIFPHCSQWKLTFRACGWQSQWSQCWRIYYSCVTVQNKHTLHGPAVPAGEPIISNSFCNPASPGNSKAPVFVTSQSEFFVVYPFCFWLFGSRNNRLRSR